MEIPMEIVEKYGEKITVKKKGIITPIGKVEKYLYFLDKGLVRMYSLSNRGDECTFDFVVEGDFTNAFESYKYEIPSEIGIQAMTQCTLFRFHKKTIQEAVDSGSIERNIYISVLENTFLRKLNREISLIKQTTREQYDTLLTNQTALFDEVPLKHIASYLGVSAQTISRFRRAE